MKALIARRPGEIVYEDVADAELEPGGVLVRTKVSAVSSGTEQRMLYGRPNDVREPAPDFPVVGAFGYLAAGDVVAVGDDVRGLEVGDRVSCGREWGAHRELLDTPAASVIKIPDDMSYLEGAASYWAVPPMAGILAGRPRFYSDAAVIGLGPLGLAAVQMLVPSSRRVVAIDIVPSRIERAETYGARGVDASHPDCRRQVAPARPDLVVECSGTQAGLELALEIARPKARVALVGVPPPLSGMDLFWPMQHKGIELVPLHRETDATPQGGGAGSPRETYLPDVLDMISQGRLDISGLTSWVVPPREAGAAFRLLRDRPDRVLGAAFAWDPAEESGYESFREALVTG